MNITDNLKKDISNAPEWCQDAIVSESEVKVLEAELGNVSYKCWGKGTNDKTIVLTCSEKIQKNRVLKRKGWDKKRLMLTKNQQFEDKKKKKLADIVIYSDRGKRYMYNMVYNLLNKSCYISNRSNSSIIMNFRK